MRPYWIVIVFLAIGFVGVCSVRAAEDETTWKQYIETGSNCVRTAEDATNSRDRRDNIERASGQFQAAVRIGKDKSNWRPLVMAAEGYVRLVVVATGNDKDNFTDLATSALDSAAKMAKDKAQREGLSAAIRVYGHLARISAGEKKKDIETKIQSLEKDAEGLPGPIRRPR